MIGYVVTPENPEGPSLDPRTFAHPGPAMAVAQQEAERFSAAEWLESSIGGRLATIRLVYADPEKWAAGCEDCLRAVGQHHDCTGQDGPVRELEAILMHKGSVRA